MKNFSQIKYGVWKKNSDKWFLVLLLIYTYICGSYIPLAKAAGLSVAEYVLLLISNHYYVIYGLTICTMYWIFVSTRQSGKLELLRYKTYRRYYTDKLIRLIMEVVLLIMAHLLIAFIIGSFNLKINDPFSGHTLSGYYSETLAFLITFKEYFANPIQASLFVSLYLMAGLCFICEIVFFVYDMCGSRMAILAMFLIIVDILLGFKLQIDESWLEVLFFNNYILLHHPLFLVSPAAVIINITVMFFLSLILCRMAIRIKRGGVRKRHKRDEYISHNLAGAWKGILLFIVIVTFIGVAPVLSAGGGCLDCMFALTAGFSKNGIQLLSFLYYLAPFIFPVFIADMFYEKVRDDRTILARFRYQREDRWSRCVRFAGFQFLFQYYLIFLTVQLASAAAIQLIFSRNASGFNSTVLNYYGLNIKQMGAVIAVSFVMKFAELSVVFTFNAVCAKNLRNTTAAFFLTFAGYGILLLTQGCEYNFMNYCGNASVYQMLEEYLKSGFGGMVTKNAMVYVVSWLAIVLTSVILDMTREDLRWKRRSSY